MALAGIIVLGVAGFVVLTLVAGIIDAEWELRQRNKMNRVNPDSQKVNADGQKVHRR
ncbi:hypothetical protein ES708_30833 [subsurface metagenome]